jgi:hypothetical protein
MRAYDFIIPSVKERSELEELLAEEFGGFTVHHGRGAWHGPASLVHKAVAIYRVALTWRAILFEGAERRLFALALGFAKQEGEKALYYGTPGRPGIYPTGN